MRPKSRPVFGPRGRGRNEDLTSLGLGRGCLVVRGRTKRILLWPGAQTVNGDTFVVKVKVKLHLFDMLWICCTTSCTTSPQQIHNKSTTSRNVVQQIHNKSNKWSLTFMRHNTQPRSLRRDVQILSLRIAEAEDKKNRRS